MRINLTGPTDLTKNLAYRLGEAGISTSYGLAAPYGTQYDLNLYLADELMLDGVEGPLETELLRQLEVHYPTPIKISRAGGVRSDLAMSIGVPYKHLPSLEFALLRTIVQLRNRFLEDTPPPSAAPPLELPKISFWRRVYNYFMTLGAY